MTDQKESLMLGFAKAFVTNMSHQSANWKQFSPEDVAKMAFDYAEALADEFIKRQGA